MRRMRTVSPAGNSVEACTALSETTQTSAARAPSPIDTARASACSAMRQKPPGMMIQPFSVAAANTRSTNGRGVRRPFSHTGVVDSRTSSWPTKSMPRSLIAPISRSRSAGGSSPASTGPLPGKPGTAAAIGAFDREIVEPRQHFLARRFLPAPPGRDVRHLQFLAEQAARTETAGSRAAPSPPARRSPACWRPRRRPCAATSIRPGTPRCEEASSSSGSRKLESTRRSSTSIRFRPATVRIWMRSPLTARSSPSTSMKPR